MKLVRYQIPVPVQKRTVNVQNILDHFRNITHTSSRTTNLDLNESREFIHWQTNLNILN